MESYVADGAGTVKTFEKLSGARLFGAVGFNKSSAVGSEELP